jgi:hypothetical protein
MESYAPNFQLLLLADSSKCSAICAVELTHNQHQSVWVIASHFPMRHKRSLDPAANWQRRDSYQ